MKKRRTQLPDNFPSDAEKLAATTFWQSKERSDLETRLEDIVDEFRSHHEARGTLFMSWPAAWKTWYVRCLRYIAPPKQQPSKFEVVRRRGGEPFRAANSERAKMDSERRELDDFFAQRIRGNRP